MVELYIPPPAEQVYDSQVPGQFDGFPIEKYFAARFDYLSEDEWARRIRRGKITLNGERVLPGVPVRTSDRTITRMEPRTEPPSNRRLEVIYQDRWLRIFNKAAPIAVHPCGRYFRNSMTELLKDVYPDEIPRPVQRLDATTTGCIVFARTREAAAFLMNQFQNNQVEKEYLALVEGFPKQDRFVVEAPIGKLKGSRRAVGENTIRPKPAVTEVERLGSVGGRSLLRVVPRSGRTNQIRVHLAHVGLPLVNDEVYGHGRHSDSQFGLHARRLRFRCFHLEIDIAAACPVHFKPYLKKSPEGEQ